MAGTMTDEQRRDFLSAGTRTAIVSTTRKDGRPHAAPVWFVLDGDVVVFMTGAGTVKGRTLARTGQAAVTVDDADLPYGFVAMTGRVELSDDLRAMLPWSIRIAERYVGSERAEAFGRRNAVAGELLVRFTADSVVAVAGVAD